VFGVDGVLWVGVDESGDLGFDFSKRGTTRFLVVAYVFTSDVFSVRKRMRRLLRKLVKRRLWFKEFPELKFSVSKRRALERGIGEDLVAKVIGNLEETRLKVLSEICGLKDCDVYAAVSIVDKTQASSELQKNPASFYNYVFVHTLITRFLKRYSPQRGEHVVVLLDKRFGARAEKSLKEYMRSKYLYMRDDVYRINYDVDIEFKQVNSSNEPLIWVADFVAASVYMIYEHGEHKYFDVIKPIMFDCAHFWEGPQKCYDDLELMLM